MMSATPSVVWFRRDLRLEDNPALTAAAHRGGPVIPVFIWEPEEHGGWPPGAASRWWLHHSLRALDKALQSLGSRLILRSGPSSETLKSLIEETKATAVFWNRLCEPAIANRDSDIWMFLEDRVDVVGTFNGSLLFEPERIRTKQGDPYRVFTPFWKNCREQDPPREPLPRPKKLASLETWPSSLELAELKLLPKTDWTGGLEETWTPGAAGAEKRLARFLDRALADYGKQRDFPAKRGTSELSPHLHFGEISPWQVWHAVRDIAGGDLRTTDGKSGEIYQAELGWREFAHHVLYHFPHTTDLPLNEKFADFPWETNAESLATWQKGKTGYPIVDAAMRQLWETGWMHNRMRMVVASFLTKDLRISWQEGAKWFWDTLVDADLANNTLGWQWAGGSGADAVPYFRIFNPSKQGEKFDPKGEYVRRYLPELAKLPNGLIHSPWKAEASALAEANLELGRDYPKPIVDHAAARKKALEAFENVKA
jgi:deoxyribodipyrimidine photo-lyase